jgi:hypothetical protein
LVFFSYAPSPVFVGVCFVLVAHAHP